MMVMRVSDLVLAIILFLITGALMYNLGRMTEIQKLLKSRSNSKEGQRLIEESETLQTGLGTLNYHLQTAAALKEAAKGHEAEAAAIADRLQTEAKITKDRLTFSK